MQGEGNSCICAIQVLIALYAACLQSSRTQGQHTKERGGDRPENPSWGSSESPNLSRLPRSEGWVVEPRTKTNAWHRRHAKLIHTATLRKMYAQACRSRRSNSSLKKLQDHSPPSSTAKPLSLSSQSWMIHLSLHPD